MGVQCQRINAEGRGSKKCDIPHRPLRVFLSLHERLNGYGKSVRLAGSADDDAYGSAKGVNRAFHKLRNGRGVRSPPLQDFRAGSVSGGDNAQTIAGPLNGITHVDQEVFRMSPDIFVAGDNNFSGCAIAGIDEPFRSISSGWMQRRLICRRRYRGVRSR